MNGALFKRATGWVPIGMSLLALTVAIAHAVVSGTVREADEGTAAHLWQLLMAGQMPLVAVFGIQWLPSAPRQALAVLAAQLGAALAAAFPVWWFQW